MFKNFRTLIAGILPLLAIIVVVPACKKKDVYPAQTLPAISGIFPGAAFAGTPVTIKGANLKNVEMVRFDTVSIRTFVGSVSDTGVTVIVPDSLPVGKIFVQVYYKDGAGYTAYNFTVLPTPKIPKVDSLSATTALPGEVVILYGKNFDVVTDVHFGITPAVFTSTADKLRATIPADAAGGLSTITLTAPEGADTIPFTVSQAPVITSMSPAFGKVGDAITLTGERLTGTTSVKVGNVDAQFTSVTPTQLVFTVPTGAITAKVTVVTPEGSGVSPAVFTVESGSYTWVYKAFDGFTANYSYSGPWSGVTDYANTDFVKTGENVSTKHTYQAQWSGYKTGIANADISTGTFFIMSVYGPPGSNGKKTKIVLNGDYNNGYEITLQEGVWQDIKAPMSAFGSPATLTEIVLQEYSGDPFTEWSFYLTDMGVVK